MTADPAANEREVLLAACAQRYLAAHYDVLEANIATRYVSPIEPRYHQLLTIIDGATLLLSKAKWLMMRSTGDLAGFGVATHSNSDLERAIDLFGRCEALARRCHSDELETASREAGELIERARPAGNEVVIFDDMPIVPSICPIVILSGSSVAMGRQYVDQILEIYGEFPFRSLESVAADAGTCDVIRRWETFLRRHAPETIEMTHGMRDALVGHGIDVDYLQVLSLWTGVDAPLREVGDIGVLDAEGGGIRGYFGNAMLNQKQTLTSEQDLCSGFAVWGDGTNGNGMTGAGSTDHDCTFQATIVAYPDDGYPFVYTPFSVNGTIPSVGRFHFAGHPGVNQKGLAYIHHGGMCGTNAPPADWGYGLRRGAQNLHALRYCASAAEAEAFELDCPVGDAGAVMGSVGGLYADSDNGHVIEAAKSSARPSAAIRRSTPDAEGTERCFLYATNNPLSPESENCFCPPPQGYQFDPVHGWHCDIGGDWLAGTSGEATRRVWAVSSKMRNAYLHAAITSRYGFFDIDAAEDVYRRGPRYGDEPWRATERRLATDTSLSGSAANRTNAFVAAVGVFEDEDIVTRAAIGPLTHRSATPVRPGHGFFYFDETNASWEIRLKDDPGALVDAAIEEARSRIARAQTALRELNSPPPKRQADLLQRAESELKAGESSAADDDRRRVAAPGDRAAATLARRLRCATRAQVRAAQVIQECRRAARMPSTASVND